MASNGNQILPKGFISGSVDSARFLIQPMRRIGYAFLNDKQEVVKEENAGMPILAIKDRRTGMMQSRVVPAKGNDKFAIKRLVKDIELLGYNKVILKSDNESSILALKKSVKEITKVEIIPEESPEKRSPSEWRN